MKDLMLEYLSTKRLKESGLFHEPYIRTMIDQHLQNRQNHAHRLWPLILFHLWSERFSRNS